MSSVIPESMKIRRTRGRPRLMKIPESFQVLGHTVTVLKVTQEELVRIDKEETPDSDSDVISGMYDHKNKIIYLCVDLVGDDLEQTFLHEKTHCILEHIGYDELSCDERFVNLFAEVDFQISKTFKTLKKHKVVTTNAK